MITTNIYTLTKCTLVVIMIAVIVMVLFAIEHPKEYNCNNFSSYQQALRVFHSNKVDIFHLDSDNDGIPCEMLITR